MKNFRITIMLALGITFILFTGSMKAQYPSPAGWFQQTGFGYDSTTKVYSIDFKWVDGLVDDEHPQADTYYLYRAFIGHDTPIDNYELVGTITSDNKVDGVYYYTDEMLTGAGYFYYLIGYADDVMGESTQVIQAFSPASYCVNMDAEIVDFISFPETMAIPGDNYSYEAYAKHRSFRVQGWVRYSLVEGPEGMTIDNKTGLLSWDVPSDASGDYYVEIKATSDEDDRAESVQQWYIRIATDAEIKLNTTSVAETIEINSINIYPNPALSSLKLNYYSQSSNVTIDLLNYSGAVEASFLKELTVGNTEIVIPVDGLAAGMYIIRINDKNKFSYGKVIIR